jgi:hypothetical protein
VEPHIRNDVLKRFVKYASVFLLGLFAGGLTMHSIASRSIDGAASAIRSQLRVYEEFRAIRERCGNRYAAAVPHAWNTVAWSGPGVPKEFKVSPDASRVVGLAMLATMDADLRRNTEIVTAIDRAKLAITLEKAGHADLAQSQWEMVQRDDATTSRESKRELAQALLDHECADRPWKNLGL